MSRSLSANRTSFDSLKVRMRCGASWLASRMRWTERRLTPAAFGQHPSGPVGGLARWRAKRKIDDAPNRFRRQRRLAGRQQPVDAILHETLLPAPDDGFGLARPPHHLERAAAVGGGQNDPGPPHMLLRRTAICHDRLKPTAIFRRDVDDDPCSHPESLNCFARFGNRLKESDH